MDSSALRALWAVPDIRRVAGAGAAASFTMSGEQIITGVLVIRLTESPAWVGATLALSFLPMLLLGGLAGTLADRFSRPKLLLGLEFSLALLLLGFALWSSALGLSLSALLALSFVAGCARALGHPVRLSYVFDLTVSRSAITGLSLAGLCGRGGQLIGAATIGFVLSKLGSSSALAVLAALQLVAVWLLLRLEDAATRQAADPTPWLENMRDTLTELRGNRVLLLVVFIITAVEMFGFSFLAALPSLADELLRGEAQALGALHAARAGGGLVSTFILAAMGGHRNVGALFTVVISGFGLTLLGLSLSTTLLLAAVATFFVASCAALSDVCSQSLIQQAVPDRMRGRAMGVWVVALGSAPLGHLQMGALASFAGVSNAILLNGIILLSLGLTITWRRALHNQSDVL